MHPATQHLLNFFRFEHLPPHLQEIAKPLGDIAHNMATTLPESPEVSVGLRKLLEAKDCFVRANLRAGDHHGPKEG